MGRVNLVEELQRALDAKEEFMSMVSHELRTPLNGLIGELLPSAPVPAACSMCCTAAAASSQKLTLRLEMLCQVLKKVLWQSTLPQ